MELVKQWFKTYVSKLKPLALNIFTFFHFFTVFTFFRAPKNPKNQNKLLVLENFKPWREAFTFSKERKIRSGGRLRFLLQFWHHQIDPSFFYILLRNTTLTCGWCSQPVMFSSNQDEIGHATSCGLIFSKSAQSDGSEWITISVWDFQWAKRRSETKETEASWGRVQ